MPTFYQRVTLLEQRYPDWSQTTHRPGADTSKNSCINNRCRLQSETGWKDGSCEQGHIHICICVCVLPYACLPACIFIGMDRARQNQTTADLLSGLQSPHLLTRGQWWAYRCAHVPRPSPTPLSPPLTSSPRIDPPLSVRCGEDQQPRQCPFHHSGPQCSFHKLSQALGLKGRIAMGFGLCKHTDACGWQVGAQNAVPTPSSFHSVRP